MDTWNSGDLYTAEDYDTDSRLYLNGDDIMCFALGAPDDKLHLCGDCDLRLGEHR